MLKFLIGLTLFLFCTLGCADEELTSVPLITQCGPTKLWFEVLNKKLGLKPIVLGHAEIDLNDETHEALVVTWFSEESKAMAVTQTLDNGTTCLLVVAGEAHYAIPGIGI